MHNLPTVILKPGEVDRVLRGHPWIYEGAVLRLTDSAADGDEVQIKDHRRRFLGVGLYNSKSKIRVRVLSEERVAIDERFFAARIQAALALRRKHLPTATAFRVVNAESDFLSGLIVDKYEDVLVLQISAAGMERRKSMILAALQPLFKPSAILERRDIASRRFEGLAEIPEAPTEVVTTTPAPALPPGSPILPTAPAAPVPASRPHLRIRLNGLQFEVDLEGGHKTGLYLDQQVNYSRVAELAAGAQVLDCFCFIGGFALHAARSGAAQVHGLDQSAEAVAAATRNASLNALGDRCSFEAANVFDWLKSQTASRPHEKTVPRFDLVILDPPSFTRNRAAVPDALRGYKEIHLRALKLLKPGGTLVTFCCSHHVSGPMFQEVILEASFDARRLLRRIATYAQSPDHPIIPAIPETEYLKGFAFESVN